MPRYGSKVPMPAKAGGPAGSVVTKGIPGGGFLTEARGLISEVKGLMQFFQELQGMQKEGQEREINGREPADRALPPGKEPEPALNPAAAAFMAKFGDMKVAELLEMIKPMTIKQLAKVMQSGTGLSK